MLPHRTKCPPTLIPGLSLPPSVPSDTLPAEQQQGPCLVTDSLPNCIHSLMTIWLKYYAKVSPPVCSSPPNLILIWKREITFTSMTEDAINFYLIFIMAAILTYVWLSFRCHCFCPKWRPIFHLWCLYGRWKCGASASSRDLIQVIYQMSCDLLW